MNKFLDKFTDKLVVFSNFKTVMALKDGAMYIMPITLVGSIFLLIANFPISNWAGIMTNIFGESWNIGLKQVSACTFDIMAIIAVLGISYTFAKNEGVDAISCSLLCLVSFLIITNSSVVSQNGDVVNGVIPKAWVNGNGVISAIIIGITMPRIFTFFIKRKIVFKMPDGVPEGVSNAFAALIPGFVIMLISMAAYQICKVVAGLSLTEIIFKVIQAPLQSLSDTLPGGLIIILLMSLLFWVGMHGPNIVNGIVSSLLLANAMSNQAILDAGQALVVNENAKIITKQFTENFAKFGGTGITLGLIIAAFIVARSQQMKSICRMSFIPGLFNVNEPVIFGLPIVLNPIMLVPFILVPVGAVIITYCAIRFGFMQPFGGLILPWTTPPIIGGFLLGGIRGAITQLVILVYSVIVYLPFVKMQDDLFLKEEK